MILNVFRSGSPEGGCKPDFDRQGFQTHPRCSLDGNASIILDLFFILEKSRKMR